MKKYKSLAIILVLLYFVQSFLLASGGIGADSLSYFGIAADFPELKTNLFPLGYPLMLRAFEMVFQDYFWAYKALSACMMACLFIFSWKKKFYFRETVLLFTGKTTFYAFAGAVSEGPFLFVMYFLLYVFYQFFEGKLKNTAFITYTAILVLLMFSIRYAGIYVLLALIVFGFIGIFKKWKKYFLRTYFTAIFFSGLGIFVYLCINYFYFGSFTGEEKRGWPQFHLIYFFRDLMGVINVVDPYIGIKPASNNAFSIGFQVVLAIANLVFLFFVIRFLKKRKEILSRYFLLLWVISGVYALSLWMSGYFQQIEEMNVRMMAPANFCFFFSLLLIYFKSGLKEVMVWWTGIFMLTFLVIYNIKSPVWYFTYRKEIKQQKDKFYGKKFIFNDEREDVLSTVYTLPIIHKTFTYAHTNSQLGEIKQSLVGTLNPKIKWLKYDTVRQKKEILYTSEVILKK